MSTVSAAISKRERSEVKSPVHIPTSRPKPCTWANSRAEVFSINFIRSKNIPVRVRRLIVHLALGYLGANIVLMVCFLSLAGAFQAQSRKLQDSLPAQSSSSADGALTEQMGSLYKKASENLTRLNSVIAVRKQIFPVAGRLAALARTLPTRTWITQLSGERDERTIHLSANYLIDKEHPSDLPVKEWTDALKADPYFGQNLKRLDINSSSRKTQGKAELFSFDMIAQWKYSTDVR